MTGGSVLPKIVPASDFAPIERSLFGRPTKALYKAAVAKCIRQIKASHNLTNTRMAEILACDEKTIRSAEDGDNGCLDTIILLNIAYAFGEGAIAPVRALYITDDAGELSPLSRIERANREIADAMAEMGAATPQGKKYEAAMAAMREAAE